MRRTSRLLSLVCVVALGALLAPAAVYADSITTLPEFNGNGHYMDPGPYQSAAVVGTFNIHAGDTAIALSGTFGNSLTPSTAGVDLYLGSILVAQCVEHSQCYESLTVVTPWSFTLNAAQIALLGTGTVDLTAVQTSQFTTRLGETTMTQLFPETAPAPEPSTLLLLGTGALGVASLLRRRF